MSFVDSSNPGFDPTATASESSPFSISPLQIGELGIGAGALGYLAGKGPQALPQQYGDLTGSVPGLRAEGQALEREGSVLTGQGTEALRMAQAGQLTDPQKAQLGQFSTGLENQTRQQFYNMGRDPNQDTGFIGQSAANDAQVNAMAQQQIQSTIALGLGELSSGASFSGQGLGFENAANNALIQAGQAQLQSDQAYSKSLTDTFATIGKMFGAVLGV